MTHTHHHTQHFLSVSLDLHKKEFKFEVNGAPCTVVAPFQVECASEREKERVESVLYRAFLALWPIPEGFGWCGCGEHDDADHTSKKRRTLGVCFDFDRSSDKKIKIATGRRIAADSRAGAVMRSGRRGVIFQFVDRLSHFSAIFGGNHATPT